uniref:F-box domain-containing protein n=1 Tax=Panagrellus redivivus TaxID=6233 RepID=A0A7E4VQD0_PANRE
MPFERVYYNVEDLEKQFNETDNPWRRQSRLLLMQIQGVDDDRLKVLELEGHIRSRDPAQLGRCITSINVAKSSPEVQQCLQAAYDLILDPANHALSATFVKNIPSGVLFRIFDQLRPWKQNLSQAVRLFHLVAKHNPEGFNPIARDFVAFLKHSLVATKNDLEGRLAFSMIFFHIFDACVKQGLNFVQQEIFRCMINCSVLSELRPEVFTKEVLSCNASLPPLPFLPSEKLSYGVKVLYMKQTTPQQRQGLMNIDDVTEETVPQAIQTVLQVKPNDKDAIIAGLLHGLCIWKRAIGDKVVLVYPAKVYDFSPAAFDGSWRGVSKFPIKVDVECITKAVVPGFTNHTGLIASLKTTVFLLMKHNKLITAPSFFDDYLGLDFVQLWSYFLTALLLFEEYTLAGTLLSMQVDVAMSNLLFLQVELGQGRLKEALSIANALLSTLDTQWHSAAFHPGIVLDHRFISVEKGGVIQYIALIQAHICFLLGSQAANLAPELRDFVLGDALVMSQLLYLYGMGGTISTYVSQIIEKNKSFTFPRLMDYICCGQVFRPLTAIQGVTWNVCNKTTDNIVEPLLEALSSIKSPDDMKALLRVKKFIHEHNSVFIDLKSAT